MSKLINAMFAYFPQTEVMVRIVYKKYLKSKRIGLVNNYIKVNKPKNLAIEEGLWQKYIYEIRHLGIKKGDILVVHSSYDGLLKMGKSVDEIIDFLLELVGKDGTLVMPAYPYYKETEIKPEYDEVEEKVKKYNPKVTPAWTGEIPNAMCGRKEAVRSAYPYNSLVAIGKEAELMMEHNMEGDLAYGVGSAWRYCSDRNAKVIFIGVEPFHSISAIHLAEDTLDKEWPIEGWYKRQKYEIKVDGQKINKECRVRKNYWSKYLTEQYCVKQLEKDGILENKKIEGIPLSHIPSLSKMTEYVIENVRKGNLLFYRIPRRYWKSR